MSKLYELSGELIELENAIGSNEISIEDARDTIEALSMQFDQKACLLYTSDAADE